MKTWATIAAVVTGVFLTAVVLACFVSGWFWPVVVLTGAAIPAWIPLPMTDFGLRFFYESRKAVEHEAAVAALTEKDRRWLVERGWRPSS